MADRKPAARRVPQWRGADVTPETIVGAWKRGTERMKNRSARVIEAQGLRRGTLTTALSAQFISLHPEIAASSLSLMPQREGLERDLIAKAGAAEPTAERAPLNATETAVRQAEEFKAYATEVASSADQGVPTQVFIEKGVEDGEFGVVAFPSDLDMDGLPDFFDRLDERAYAALKSDQQQEYTPDQNRPRSYSRKNADGSARISPTYARDASGKPTKNASAADREKSKEAHDDAVRRYLLDKPASSFRVIPALDCVPFLIRGKGKRRWEPVALIERTRVEPEELERSYGWAMLGNQLLLPRGFDTTQSGNGGQYYLYSMYYVQRDAAGCERTICCYTVGGAGTWRAGADATDQQMDSVACIDLYAERGLEGRFFDYIHALHTSDDDADWYGRPYIWSLKNRILNIEGLETAANASVQLNAYTGHFQVMDGNSIEALDRIDPEAVVDSATHSIRRAKLPGPGEIEPVSGQIIPAQQAQIGRDAHLMHQNYTQSLAEATMIDQQPTSGPSGNAMMVSESQGQIAKRHVREAALVGWEFCLQADARIRQAAFVKYQVRWPINTTKDRPVGQQMVDTSVVAEWNPDWIGDGNYTITGDYGEEFNLAKADLVVKGYLQGVRTLEHVAEAFGDEDVMSLRIGLATDALWKEPASQALLQSVVAQLRGMQRQQQALAAQNAGQMNKVALPGAPLGVPQAMLNRQPGAQQPQQPGPPGAAQMGPGGPGIAASSRGGIVAGAMGSARAAQAALAQAGAA